MPEDVASLCPRVECAYGLAVEMSTVWLHPVGKRPQFAVIKHALGVSAFQIVVAVLPRPFIATVDGGKAPCLLGLKII